MGDSDTGRCVCLACCRTVITNSTDIVPLWDKVIDFFEGPLGLITSEEYCASSSSSSISSSNGNSNNSDSSVGVITRQDMKQIPVLVVGMEALNSNIKRNGSVHFGSNQIMTRGLCLSERCNNANYAAAAAAANLNNASSGTRGRLSNGGVGVTAILILSGLPSDLTASILAHGTCVVLNNVCFCLSSARSFAIPFHSFLTQCIYPYNNSEATHAWIKLHPNFPFNDPLPLRVEEGLCQLVAFLFLNMMDDTKLSHHSSTLSAVEDDSIPSDEKLRQYFRFCIETDHGVYGEGFRLAARAYAKMGIQELLYYVAIHHDFPPL